MNAEHLYEIIKEVQKEWRDGRIVENLTNMANGLTNQVNQPNAPQHQQQVVTHRTALEDNLGTAPSDSFSPAWRQSLVELGLAPYLGRELRATIANIFGRNAITPSVARDEITAISQRVEALRQEVDKLISGMDALGINAAKLKPGESEVGILIPRIFVKNDLKRFGAELKELDSIFETFAELATGSRPGFQIRAISSSDLTVYLNAASGIAACAAVAIERIVALYKQLLEVRKLQNELKKNGVSDENLKGVRDHAESQMDTGIDKLADELLAEYFKSREESRRNEMRTATRIALKKLAARVDRGFNIEIRVEPLPAPDGEDDESTEEAKNVSKIQAAASQLTFIHAEGEPILTLPPNEQSETDDSADIEAGKGKKKK